MPFRIYIIMCLKDGARYIICNTFFNNSLTKRLLTCTCNIDLIFKIVKLQRAKRVWQYDTTAVCPRMQCRCMDFCVLDYGPNIQRAHVHAICCLLESASSSNQGLLTITIQWIYNTWCRTMWDMPHFILFGTRGITFKVVVCFNAYMTIYGMKKLADFYIGLYCQPGVHGNLGKRSVTISTSYEHYPCMHAMVIQLCCHSLRLNARQYGARQNDCTAANECFEVQFTHAKKIKPALNCMHGQ